MLVIDDLQWADAGSISLFFHLGRRLRGQLSGTPCTCRPGASRSSPSRCCADCRSGETW
jgi:predicted ATPase